MKTSTKLTVYSNDLICKEDDGTFLWVANSEDDERFDDISDLLNYAKEEEPQAYEAILSWAEEYDL